MCRNLGHEFLLLVLISSHTKQVFCQLQHLAIQEYIYLRESEIWSLAVKNLYFKVLVPRHTMLHNSRQEKSRHFPSDSHRKYIVTEQIMKHNVERSKLNNHRSIQEDQRKEMKQYFKQQKDSFSVVKNHVQQTFSTQTHF